MCEVRGRGRPVKEWEQIPVSGKTMTVKEAAEYLGLETNTLYKQLSRDRAYCVSDGHAVRVNSVWQIHTSIKELFQQG